VASVNVKEIVGETLRYLGHALFDIHDTGMKVVVTLQSGETHWFFYSTAIDRRSVIGETVMWLMDRENETFGRPTDGGGV